MAALCAGPSSSAAAGPDVDPLEAFAGEIMELLAAGDNFLSDITLGTEPEDFAAAALVTKTRPADKHTEDRQAKRARIEPPGGSAGLGADAPYDAKIKDRRQVAEGMWLASAGTVELVTMRGNFWRVMGYSNNRKNYLWPEEALLLVEKAQLCVSRPATPTPQHIPSSVFYEEVLRSLPLPCYLTYVKLKSLEYVTFRHSQKHAPRSFAGDADIFRHMSANPSARLLETLIAFDVYAHTSNWSKKTAMERPPAAHVLVMTGDWTLSARLLLRLLEEARGVPVIFAAVLPSGNLILEEFTDAQNSLDWTNVYARPIDMSIDLTKIPQPIQQPKPAAAVEEAPVVEKPEAVVVGEKEG